MRNFIEYDTATNIKNLQSKLLKKTVQYVCQYSPFYQKIFRKQNVNVEKILTVDDLVNLPVISKRDLLEHNKQFICCDKMHSSDIVTTSGSTGLQPIVHPLTKNDLVRLTYNEYISFMSPPIRNNDFVMLATALDGSFVAGLAYYLGIKRIGATIIRAGSKMNIEYEILKEFPVTTIIGVPSNLINLQEYCLNRRMIKGKFNIEKLILIGESIRNRDFSLNALGKRLAECYPNANLYSTYANTETCVSFCECNAKKGGHLHPNLAYIEILDNNNQRVKDGEIGRLVITTFGNQSMPLIRYDTGDITFTVSEPCECGRTSQRIGPILGREKNIIKIQGVTFSQLQLENLLLCSDNIVDYYVKVQNGTNGIPFIALWISCKVDDGKELKRIKQIIWEELRVNVQVNLCTTEELMNVQKSIGSRKKVRFINITNEV